MEENTEHLKKFINKKIIVSIGSIIALFLSIVIMTLVQADFDFNKALNNSSNLVINSAIAISSIICGYYLFQSYLYNNPKGEYQMAALDFRKSRLEYEKHSNVFSDWHNDVYYPRERKAVFEDILRRCGIQQMEVLDLDITEIKSLLNKPQKIKDKIFMSLTEEQVKILMKIKTGKILVNKLPDDYFYDIRGLFSNKRAYVRANKEGITKSSRFTYQIVSKILMGVITTTVFAGLIYNEETDTKQMWLNLVTRLYTMFSNILYGYIVSRNTMLVELYFIKYKTHVLQLFNIDVKNGFKAKSIEEKALEEYERNKENEQKDKVLDRSN